MCVSVGVFVHYTVIIVITVIIVNNVYLYYSNVVNNYVHCIVNIVNDVYFYILKRWPLFNFVFSDLALIILK